MTEEKKYSKKKGKFLICFVVLIVAVLVGVNLNSASEDVVEEIYPTGGEGMFYDPEPTQEEKETTQSDIEGLTIAQKEELGLRWEDGSDSDWDGISDKDEIEIYNSDPTKTSTAGDLYTDYYKIQNGMDVNTYYEYEGEFVFEFNHTSELIPSPVNAIDYQANFRQLDKTSEFGDTGYPTYSPLVKVPVRLYRISQFSGKLSIDCSNFLEETGKNIDDFEIYTYVTSKESKDECGNYKLDYDINENTVSIKDFEFEFKNSYEVYIVEKDAPVINRIISNAAGDLEDTSIFNSLESISETISLNDNEYETIVLDDETEKQEWFQETGGVLTIGNAYLGGTENIYPMIYYVDMVDKSGNSIDTTIDAITDAWNEYMLTPDRLFQKISMTRENSPNQYVKVSPKKILLMKKACDIFLGTFHKPHYTYESDMNDKEAVKAEKVLAWYTYRDWLDYYDSSKNKAKVSEIIPVEIEPRPPYSINGGDNDIFPFTNFTTEKNPGVCAGIAYYEAYIYNNGKYEGIGNYGSHSWNVTNDTANKMLLARHGLGKFKDENWTNEKSEQIVIDVEKHWFSDDVVTTKRGNIDKNLLSDGERQFVEMIEGFHEKFNDKAYQPLCTDYTFDKRCTYDRFKKIRSLIDEDQFLILSIGHRNPEDNSIVGHALLLTGINVQPHDNGDGVIYLYCADPNKSGHGTVVVFPAEKYTENHEKVEAFDYSYVTPNLEYGSTLYPEYSFSIWTTDYERYM